MTARDNRERPDVPPPPTKPSFVRRHPLLAAFGVLAGLSLFAAYWPLSAIAVGIVVAGRATGADELAWSAMRRVGARVVAAVRRHTGARDRGSTPAPEGPGPSAPQPEPAGPQPEPPAPVDPPAPRRGAPHPVAPQLTRPQHAPQARPPRRVPADTVGAGIEGPGD